MNSERLATRLVHEVFNEGKLAVIDEIFTPDFVDHNPGPDQPPGPAGFKKTVSVFRQAFPDFHMTLEDVFAAGDKVAFRDTYRGTHQGDFFGIKPTNKQVTVQEIHILRCAGGRIREHWYNGDDLSMMQQLGVVELPRHG